MAGGDLIDVGTDPSVVEVETDRILPATGETAVVVVISDRVDQPGNVWHEVTVPIGIRRNDRVTMLG
jgi:hypothetical protein